MPIFSYFRKPPPTSSTPIKVGSSVSEDVYTTVGDEYNKYLRGVHRKYDVLESMLVNFDPASTSWGYYTGIFDASDWTMVRAEVPEADIPKAEEMREKYQRIFFQDPKKSIQQIMSDALTHVLYGASIQNFWLRQEVHNGVRYNTLDDVSIRPMKTIEEFHLGVDGELYGFWQRIPTEPSLQWIPKVSALYLVDKGATDRPEGVGILRTVFVLYVLLKELQRTQSIAYVSDLVGFLIGRAPIGQLRQTIARKERVKIDDPKVDVILGQMLAPMRRSMNDRTISENRGSLIESFPWFSTGDDQRPIAMRQWDLEAIQVHGSSHEPLEQTIIRIKADVYRRFHTEQIVASQGKGSYNLVDVLNSTMGMILSGHAKYMGEQVMRQIGRTIAWLEGDDYRLLPRLRAEFPTPSDAKTQAEVLEMLGRTVFHPDDDAPDVIRNNVGLPKLPKAARGMLLKQQEMERERERDQTNNRK